MVSKSIHTPPSPYYIREAVLYYPEDNKRVGTVILEANTIKGAEKESKYVINRPFLHST